MRISTVSADGYDPDVNTEPSRSPSPDPLAPRGFKKRSGRQAVSRKARGVIGKVRAFQRIAAAKMAHPSIKIDTSVQSTKRGLPSDNDGLDMEQGNPRLDAGNTEDVPPFLCQSFTDENAEADIFIYLQRSTKNSMNLSGSRENVSRVPQTTQPTLSQLTRTPRAIARNRYLNVLAYANSRIHLQVPEGECDFINASPVTLRDSVTLKEQKYIATQGPKDDQFGIFWQMVFQESMDVGVIVMLTQTFEMGREKCAQYFPLNSEDPVMDLSSDDSDPFVSTPTSDETSGPVKTVTLLDYFFDEASRSEVRKLELTFGDETKIIWHFLFAGWADHCKPEGQDRDGLLELIKLSASKCDPANPRVVHCSAGVGRTGTFIALDHLLRELESGQLLQVTDPEADPIFDLVNHMREQRMMMVYNELQWQFIYEVVRLKTDQKLGKYAMESPGSQTEPRSAKVPKLSDEDEYVIPSKPELELAPGGVQTPMRSWSGTPKVSDDEEA
ncbi:protein-tyrosine phosphatase-like protein [Penicillium malachiteum]|uniref:protein-tyrosine phosphatase-like protein n=1 Tax=Penicillium malachiteum TaxID=1324776 RepID=UPI0025495C08|nr:protein-tyrosine phosphatase-like protein [Penicillium malachiteum]KAJ5721784.1 protein-tyrosine phosphatase-like protein [Penicillium malachiteum]